MNSIKNSIFLIHTDSSFSSVIPDNFVGKELVHLWSSLKCPYKWCVVDFIYNIINIWDILDLFEESGHIFMHHCAEDRFEIPFSVSWRDVENIHNCIAYCLWSWGFVSSKLIFLTKCSFFLLLFKNEKMLVICQKTHNSQPHNCLKYPLYSQYSSTAAVLMFSVTQQNPS